MQELSPDVFPDLKLSELNFLKLTPSAAQFFVKNEFNQTLLGTIEESPKEGMFLKLEVKFPDGDIT